MQPAQNVSDFFGATFSALAAGNSLTGVFNAFMLTPII